MNNQRAILFDLDGTLVDLNPQVSELELLRTKILNAAKRLGVSTSSTSIFDTYQLVLEQFGFHHSIAKEMRLELDGFEMQCARQHAVFKCHRPNITALRESGLCLGLVTSNGSAFLQALFETKTLEAEWFDLAITRDDSALLKPSPRPLELAIGLANEISPNLVEVWFVGDSLRDKQAVDHFNRSAKKQITFINVSSTGEIEGHPDNKIDDVLIYLLKKLKG